MLERANDLTRGSTLRADVCIVGAGAAGITLARELAGGRHSVVVLESGAFDFSEATQDLYAGTNSGLPYDVFGSRLRFFGGSTNHWAGQCRPFDQADFEERAWVPNSGWPFGRKELLPYYERAQDMCDLGPFEYDAEFWLDRMKDVDALLDTNTVRTALYQIGPATHFGTKYRKSVVDAKNVNLVLGANVVNVRVDGKRVAGVDVKTLEGNDFLVDAKLVVLALGGIENARLMLASRAQRPAGLGNEHDLVGRYFMDHSLVAFGRLLLSEAAPVPALYYFVGVPMKKAGFPDLKNLATRYVFGQFILTSQATRDAEIPNFAAMLSGLRTGQDTPGITGADIAALVGDIEGRTGLERPTLEMTTITGETRKGSDHFELQVNMEPTPNPDSRITLTAELDPLGVPRVDLRWAFHPNDYASMERGAAILAREFGRRGLGRVHLQPAETLPVKYGNHHMGTTRAHRRATQGVVDANCEVHDVVNLYVAGSSVFPAGGFSNPTLTIVALALRLAERVDKVLS
ncbi:MAG: GMC family oxidoreductase [Acidimicrobiia bacterium]